MTTPEPAEMKPKRRCIDGGACHHECEPQYCFRKETSLPLSASGLGDDWETKTDIPPAAPVADDAVEALADALPTTHENTNWKELAEDMLIILAAQGWHLRRETKAPDGVASQPEAQSAPAMTEFELKLEAERLAYGAMVDADRMQGIINLAKKYRG